MSSKHKTNNKTNERPKSSLFPSLVPTHPKPSEIRQRSSSFDYSFIETKPFDNRDNKMGLNRQSIDHFDHGLGESNINNESLDKEAVDSTPVPTEPLNDENQRLKNENQILKKNFLRMSRIIRKHSRLLAKKDELIGKLEERNFNNYLPNLSIAVKQKTVSDNQNDSQELIKSQDLRLKNEEFSLKFNQIYDSMVGQFGQHLNQFMSIIEEMQRFFENNLRAIDRKNSMDSQNEKQFETKIGSLDAEYCALKCNHEVLIKQNDNFKSFFKILCDLCGLGFKPDINVSDSAKQLENHLNRIFSENKSLNLELEAMKLSLQRQEDYCLALVEAISEVELELELLGRSHETLSDVIEKFERNVHIIHKRFKISYFDSLNKTLSQIYKNQIKSIDSIKRPMKSIQTNTDFSTDQDLNNESTEPIACSSGEGEDHLFQNQELLSDKQMFDFEDPAEDIQDIQLFKDEPKFDDFDLESINYILSAKYFNLKTNLEVVEEVEEEEYEEIEEEEEEEEEETLDYSEDSVFERTRSEDKNDLNDHNLINDNDIDNEVKLILNEILDEIDKTFCDRNEKYLENMEDLETERLDLSRNSIDSVFAKTNEDSTVIEIKPQNIDSDFVSEDICSSPEAAFVSANDNNCNNNDNTYQTLHYMKNKIFEVQSNKKDPNFDFIVDQRVQNVNMDDNLKAKAKLDQISELISARNRIKHLENQLSSDSNFGRPKEQQYLSDELKAWKELVEQQKAIMEKIRNELEWQQKINSEKDKVIESLSRSRSRNSVNSVGDDTDDDFTTSLNELDLNHLFVDNRDSDEADIEEIEAIDNRVKSSLKLDINKSPDISAQEVWTKDEDNRDSNYVSSIDNEPVSAPVELLSTRKKVFIPYSHEDASVRRHSCHDRVIHHGNHPRKRKLKLKNIDIVFPSEN